MQIFEGVLLSKRSVTYTVNGYFNVPRSVTKVWVTAIASGTNGASGIGGAAGEFVIKKEVSVTPGDMIRVIVGKGNTQFGDTIILAAGAGPRGGSAGKIYSGTGYFLATPGRDGSGNGGMGGDSGINTNTFGGGGGAGIAGFGMGGSGSDGGSINIGGTSGIGYGAGGGAGGNKGSGGWNPNGAGTPGVIHIEW